MASPGATFESLTLAWKTKKPARRLAFSCPKAGEELLLRRSGSRSSGVSLGGFSGLRSFSGLRGFDLGGFSGLRGFGLATSGNSQGEEGGYEERLLHLSEILNVMELHGQLVDRNVSIAINREFYHAKDYLWCSTTSCGCLISCFIARSCWSTNRDETVPTVLRSVAARD